MTTDLASFGRLPPFALFDEFGISCDDRVQDHYHAEIACLQAQVAELQARCIDAESDARRYRHLRNQESGDFPPKHGSVWVVMYEHPVGTTPSMISAGYGERLDANVDAALAAAGR